MNKIVLSCLFVLNSLPGFSQEFDYVKDAFAFKNGQDYRQQLMISENDSSWYDPIDSITLIYHKDRRNKIYAMQFLDFRHWEVGDSSIIEQSYWVFSKKTQKSVFEACKKFGFEQIDPNLYFKINEEHGAIFMHTYIRRRDKKVKRDYDTYMVITSYYPFVVNDTTLEIEFKVRKENSSSARSRP